MTVFSAFIVATTGKKFFQPGKVRNGALRE
jgi:hypothetical protein